MNSNRAKGEEGAKSNADENALLNASANSVLNASNVITKADLEAFASSTIEKDSNVEEIRFTKNQVEVGYKEHGKFLGLFKMLYKIRVIAHADGTVEVKYPWYAFLFATDRQGMQSEIDAAANSVLGGEASTTGNISLTANQAAELAAKIREILYVRFGAGLSITSSTTQATTTQ